METKLFRVIPIPNPANHLKINRPD